MKKFLYLFLVLVTLAMVNLVSAQTANVKIAPASQMVSLFSGDVVTVNIDITGVTGLCGFQFDLNYNNSILRLDSPDNVTEGGFLKQGATTTDWIAPKVSVTGQTGKINDAAATILKTGETYICESGDGVLATVKFRVRKDRAPGTSFLNIEDIKLSDKNSLPIDFTKNNGDVITKTCLNGENRSCVSCGVTGNRTCLNYEWGSCDVKTTRSCSVNHTGICAAGEETCTDGVWAGCPEPYLLEYCNDLDEDCDGVNNECLGDITNSTDGSPDGCVNIYDLVLVNHEFGKTSGFDERADVKRDGRIDIYDVVMVSRDWGNQLPGAEC